MDNFTLIAGRTLWNKAKLLESLLFAERQRPCFCLNLPIRETISIVHAKRLAALSDQSELWVMLRDMPRYNLDALVCSHLSQMRHSQART